MTFRIIHQGKFEHRCVLPSISDFNHGAIIQCEDCGEYYYAGIGITRAIWYRLSDYPDSKVWLQIKESKA